MAKIPDSSALGFGGSVPRARSRIPPRDQSGEIIGDAIVGMGENFGRIADAAFESDMIGLQVRAAEIMAKHKDPNFRPAPKLDPNGKPTVIMGSDGAPLLDDDGKQIVERIPLAQSFENEISTLRTNFSGKTTITGQHRRRLEGALSEEKARGLATFRVVDFAKEIDKKRAGLTENEGAAAEAVAKDPGSLEPIAKSMTRLYESHAAAGWISHEEAAERRLAWTGRGAGNVLSQKSPQERLAILDDPERTIARFLTPEQRIKMQVQAQAEAADEIETSEATSIMELYRTDAPAGAAALAALDESDLPPERQDGIRRKVRESVNLMRDERQAEFADSIARLETRLATGASYGEVEPAIETLNRRGALAPAQYASLKERSAVNAVRSAEAQAIRQEIVDAISSGIPLDPSNSKHKDFLGDAFALDVGNRKPDDPTWQAVALAYASKARMLPPQAASWLRSAARSPSVEVTSTAAEFYGALEQQSPEAAGSIDTDTKAFLGQFGGMRAAGASQQKAYETARSNVYDARRDLVEQRTKAYEPLAKENGAILTDLIDRDFDAAFSAQPAASVNLRADFDKQSEAYYVKTGDPALARELAWKDLQRVYGVTRVNGEPIVSAFPVEQFGVAPEEVRGELTGFLRGTGIAADDVLVVPDGLTLRAVSDALTGKAVAPSYRLVTKAGDLVLDADGVPVRYALPAGEELTARIEARRAKAAEGAELAIDEAIARRARIQSVERYRRENPK